jgi:hypothetical protein
MNTKIEPTVKPFYINNCTLTAAQREDLHKRCIAAGAVEERTLEEAGWCAWVGVDEDFNFTGWDCEVNFTSYGVPETTYAQVGKYVKASPAMQYWLLSVLSQGDAMQLLLKGSIVDLIIEARAEGENPVITHSIEITEDEYRRLYRLEEV